MAVRTRDPRPLRHGRFFLLAVVLACSGAVGDGPQAGAGADDQPAPVVREGMTRAEVLDAWGTPNVRVREGAGERWSYWFRDDRQRVVARAYVLFDDRGLVSEIVRRAARGAPPPPARSVPGAAVSAPPNRSAADERSPA
jgi:outer membrane protein assembly factor BamE (lipoprotein component of BamABCDE complex)